jgi:hypothetical protein
MSPFQRLGDRGVLKAVLVTGLLASVGAPATALPANTQPVTPIRPQPRESILRRDVIFSPYLPIYQYPGQVSGYEYHNGYYPNRYYPTPGNSTTIIIQDPYRRKVPYLPPAPSYFRRRSVVDHRQNHLHPEYVTPYGEYGRKTTHIRSYIRFSR